jgi:hypothetical protein
VRALLLTSIFIAASLPSHAQQGIGTVAMQDATVSGSLSVTNGRAILIGSSSVVAKDHTAEVALERGGMVRVCATSGLHLTQSQPGNTQPLMLALDRGAIEIQTGALANDVVMTPDLRFVVHTAAPIDLHMRVTKNGDTCVENRGTTAPTLSVSDQFGEASYELRTGQHVLFEHGSLKEVVDHETSPCGCPPAAEPGMSIADALIAPGTPSATSTAQQAEAQHPFPAAVSQGLAPAPPVPQAAPGAPHAQVATTLGFSGDGSGMVSGTPASVAAPITPPVPPVPASGGFGHRLSHFFKRLFGGS